MSDTHTIIGKIKKVDLKGKSIEEFAKEHMSYIKDKFFLRILYTVNGIYNCLKNMIKLVNSHLFV